MSHKNFPRSQETVGSSNRSFGLVFAVVFSLIGLFPLLQGHVPRLWALGLSVMFLATALAWPTALSLPNRWWGRLGLLLHSIVSPIALGVLFFGVITPTGVIMRLIGHDPLRLKFDRDAESYWIKRLPRPSSSMINQF